MKAYKKHFFLPCLFALVAILCLAVVISADDTEPDFTMSNSELNIPASALLAIDGCFSYDPTQFTRSGTIISCNDAPGIPDEARGQILLNGGRGDAYTFTVDFETHAVDSLGFYSYGSTAVDTVVGLEIDGQDMGSAIAYAGNGWADADTSVWYYNEITFPHTVTGLHTVVIHIVDSAPAWPANVVGNFLFYEERQIETETEFVPVPETSTETNTDTDTDTNPDTDVVTAPVTDAASGTETQTTPQTDTDVELPPDDFHGCSSNLSGLSGVALALCLILMASLFVSCRGNGTTLSAESETSSETVAATVTETDTGSDTESGHETVTETTADPDTGTEPGTGDYSFNADEQTTLREEAERMKGLTATYYSDRNATQAVSTEVVAAVDRLFQKGSGISAAVYEGYITFTESGIYAVTMSGDVQATISIGQGEHHVKSGKSVTIEAVAGAQYSVKIQANWRGDKTDMTLCLLANEKAEGFSLSVGRVLIEHETVSTAVIHDIPLRDTFICTGPDGYYYMTGTTGPDFWNNNYVIHIYRSEDLTDWEDLGVVWDFRTDATWAKTVTNDTRVPVWAPELAYINGNWYMTYSLGFNDGYCGGILVSTTGKPEGPYTDTTTSKLVDNIDGSLFQDDDGTVYYIYDEGLIAPLKDDLSGFAGEFTPLLAADGLPVGFEGCYIFKHNGRYYLTAATYNQSYNEDGKLITTYDSMIAVSDSLYGPYSDTRLLLRDGGHNNLFCDKKGNLYTTLFSPNGAQGFSCQPAIVRLKEDERGILSVAVPKTETVDVAENGVFRYIYGEGDIPSLSVSIKTRRPLDVYINGIYAFTARPSSVAMTYTISGDALAALVSGLNRISFSDTRNADLAYDLVIRNH